MRSNTINLVFLLVVSFVFPCVPCVPLWGTLSTCWIQLAKAVWFIAGQLGWLIQNPLFNNDFFGKWWQIAPCMAKSKGSYSQDPIFGKQFSATVKKILIFNGENRVYLDDYIILYKYIFEEPKKRLRHIQLSHPFSPLPLTIIINPETRYKTI